MKLILSATPKVQMLNPIAATGASCWNKMLDEPFDAFFGRAEMVITEGVAPLSINACKLTACCLVATLYINSAL